MTFSILMAFYFDAELIVVERITGFYCVNKSYFWLDSLNFEFQKKKSERSVKKTKQNMKIGHAHLAMSITAHAFNHPYASLFYWALYWSFRSRICFFCALIRFCVAPQHIQCGDRFSDHTPKYQSKHAKRIFFSVPVLNCIYTFS